MSSSTTTTGGGAAAERLRSLLFALHVAKARYGEASSSSAGGYTHTHTHADILTLTKQILQKATLALENREVQRDEKLMIVSLLVASKEPGDLLGFLEWGLSGGMVPEVCVRVCVCVGGGVSARREGSV